MGSALVLVSFLMASVAKLRIVNTVGSLIFMIYALIIHSYPTAVMNFCLVLINLHFLWKMRNTGNEYELVQVKSDDLYLQYLLLKQHEDIISCFNGLSLTPDATLDMVDFSYLITCQGAPAGITLCKNDEEEGIMELVLDYSLPAYRDFSIGFFMMKQLKERGVKKLIYKGPTENHMAYLNKMGFENCEGVFIKNL